MALSSFVGSFTVPAATGNKAVTGVGFQPKAVIFWGNRLSADGATGSATSNEDMIHFYGMATDSTHRGCVAVGDDFLSTSTNTITNGCIRAQEHTPTVRYAADFVSMDADGFTVNFTTANATAYVVNFLAFGGTDLTNAIVLSNTTPAGTGTQATTGAGFQPTAAILVGGDTTSGAGTGVGAFVGAASSTTARWVTTWGFAAGSQSYQRTAKCVAYFNQSTGAIKAEADLSSFDADGLTLNYSTAGTGATVLMLLLKGGQFKAGSLSQKTSTGTQATTGVGFTPTGLALASFCRVASASVVTAAPSMQMVGAASSTTARAAICFADGVDGVAELVRTQVYTVRSDSATPTLTAAADLSSFDADGFTLNFGTADATAREILYFAAGSTAGSLATIVPPSYPDKVPTRAASVARQTSGVWFPATIATPWDASQFARAENINPLVRARRMTPAVTTFPTFAIEKWATPTGWGAEFPDWSLRLRKSVATQPAVSRTDVVSAASTPTGWDYRDPTLPRTAKRVPPVGLTANTFAIENWAQAIDWLPVRNENPVVRAKRLNPGSTWFWDDLDWIMGGAASFLGPKQPLLRAKRLPGDSYSDPALPIVTASTPTGWYFRDPTLPRTAKRVPPVGLAANTFAIEQWAPTLGWGVTLPTASLRSARRVALGPASIDPNLVAVAATPTGWDYRDPVLPRRPRAGLNLVTTLADLGLEKWPFPLGWLADTFRPNPRRARRVAVFQELMRTDVVVIVPGLVRRTWFGRGGRRGQGQM